MGMCCCCNGDDLDRGMEVTHIIISILAGFLIIAAGQLGLGMLFAVIELIADIWLKLEELHTK